MAETLKDVTVDFVYVIVYEANFMDSALMIEKAGKLAAEEALDDAVAGFAKYSDKTPGRIIESGSSAANTIVNLAEKENYDQVIMGSKGKSNMERFLVGSVSNRIMHHAPCTVTLVR